jgi:hypothetical protein
MLLKYDTPVSNTTSQWIIPRKKQVTNCSLLNEKIQNIYCTYRHAWIRILVVRLLDCYVCARVNSGLWKRCTLTPALLYADTRSFLKFDIEYAVPVTQDALIWQREKPQRCAASFTILDVAPGEPSETIRAWLHSCGDCITRTRRQIASIVS